MQLVLLMELENTLQHLQIRHLLLSQKQQPLMHLDTHTPEIEVQVLLMEHQDIL